jgi:hypothetical protein
MVIKSFWEAILSKFIKHLIDEFFKKVDESSMK